ncbi:MAG: hypothetical protein AAGD06_06310 [Acidobacteriota bacterium]
MSNRLRTLTLSVAALLFLTLSPAVFAGTQIADIPVIGGYYISVLYQTITPPGSEVVSVSFIATYDNTGTGENAANAKFQILGPGGRLWSLTGAQLGWSGEGVFQAVRTTSSLDGPLVGSQFWESVTSWAPGQLNGKFRVVINTQNQGGPGRPDRP